MDECIGIFGRIFGHKYEGRYDKSMPGGWEIEKGTTEALKAMRTIIYRGDVCSRCGDTVNNAEKA